MLLANSMALYYRILVGFLFTCIFLCSRGISHGIIPLNERKKLVKIIVLYINKHSFATIKWWVWRKALMVLNITTNPQTNDKNQFRE